MVWVCRVAHSQYKIVLVYSEGSTKLVAVTKLLNKSWCVEYMFFLCDFADIHNSFFHLCYDFCLDSAFFIDCNVA